VTHRQNLALAGRVSAFFAGTNLCAATDAAREVATGTGSVAWPVLYALLFMVCVGATAFSMWVESKLDEETQREVA
jgi:hypothetical protein